MIRRFPLALGFAAVLVLVPARTEAAQGADAVPVFSRHVAAVFSRLGCNGGTCHGAVKGQNGFKLSLFGADPALDHDRLLHEFGGRRLNFTDPSASLLLLKATAQVAHQGGKRMAVGSPEYEVLRRWIAGGAAPDDLPKSHVAELRITPAEQTAKPGESYRLRVEAKFADGSAEDITPLCSYESLDQQVASVESDGQVRVEGVGDTALIIRYRSVPAMAMVVAPRPGAQAFPDVKPANFIDDHILAKLRRLNIPPAGMADDHTFLRRVTLDVTGELPSVKETRAFLADKDPEKRSKKIDELLKRPGYAALWTLKFGDLLKGADFGVYADGLSLQADAPRFQAWVRARMEENVPYDQLVERILTATSREGQTLEEYGKEVMAMAEGYAPGNKDVEIYKKRKTLDLWWQRQSSAGVPNTLQAAHAFLGLRLECAQCHRHPHDVWQQDDLLSFANFFMRVRRPGFGGDNAKRFPDVAAMTKAYDDEAKKLTDQVKKMRETEGKQLDADAKKAKAEATKVAQQIAQLEKQAEQLTAQAKAKRAEADKLGDKKDEAEPLRKEAADLEQKAEQVKQQVKEQQKLADDGKEAIARHDKFMKDMAAMDKRSKLLPEVSKRLLHAEIRHLADGKTFASVTSPIGTQTSNQFRLLGDKASIEVAVDQDPRPLVVAWMRRPDNPYFARAIVNRVWAHYFGRGIVDPPDNLSPFNPATHPELLKELSAGFVKNGYDLKWLHRTILRSRTYQQSSMASKANEADRRNYAYFYYRRLPAEVLLDMLNQATGTTEKMDMVYNNWPADMKTVEIPYAPRNSFVNFMLEHFGKPKRNSAVQCDCERDPNASVLQVLSFANHPRVLEKIADKDGMAARILKDMKEDDARIEAAFLVTLSRLPDEAERQACKKYLQTAESPAKGLEGIMWGLLNTREFLLQH
jgi:flagellar biosynthesis GTPase FlhF